MYLIVLNSSAPAWRYLREPKSSWGNTTSAGERDLLSACILGSWLFELRSKFELVAVDCDVTYCDHQKDDK